MSSPDRVPPATEPDDLGRIFVERANAGDVDGLVALYEPDTVLAVPPGQLAARSEAIRKVFVDFVASGVKLSPGAQRPTLRVGGLALTSTRLDDGAVTAEVARRQPDRAWRWGIDQPDVVGE